jgi:CRP-like cAMP-binding protein
MRALADIFARHGQHMKASADEVVIRRDSSIVRLFFVVSGQVVLHSTSPSGREIAFTIVRPGEVFGVTGLGSDLGAIFDATALVDCELLSVDREIVQREVLGNRAATLEVFDMMLGILRQRTRLVESLAMRSLKARLALWILARFKDSGIEPVAGASVPLDISQRLIAALAGVSRETVNRQLKEWSKHGFIQLVGRSLRILQPDQLVRIAGYTEDVQSD